MGRYMLMGAAVALAGVVVLTSSPAGAKSVAGVAGPGGGWGKAEEVPGFAALNTDGVAQFNSVSCGSAGNCSAGGSYADSSGSAHAFVDSQVNGRWREAEEVPGIAALSNRSNAGIYSVSCASAGNCSAGGNYIGSSSCTVQRCSVQGFVVSQVNGRWRTPEALPGLAALNKGNRAWVSSVSCASAGHCSAGGTYTPAFRREQAFVVSQT